MGGTGWRNIILKKLIQIILLVWFVAINVAILVPSYQLLFAPDTAGITGVLLLPQPPVPPPLVVVGPLDPNLNLEQQKQQVETYKQQVGTYVEQIKAYTQQVTAYTQQVAAYKTQKEAKDETNRLAVYEAVVKNSLVTFVGGFATTLITYVFANLGAGVVDNYVRMRMGKAPESLRLL